MAIAKEDVKLFESERMTDETDGGGRETATVIEAGVSNNLFPDISRLDRVYGRVNLRKVFLRIDNENTDVYYGAHAILTKAPEDDNVNALVFRLSNSEAIRSDARDWVESYLYKGPIWHGTIFGDLIEGMRQIRIAQRVGSELPPVGKTLVLVLNEDQTGEVEQYVRVTQVEAEERDFTDNNGDFTKLIVTLDISDTLRTHFPGFQASRYDYDIDYTGKTRVRDTSVAEAARYFGVESLREDTAYGDTTVKVPTIYSTLVPSAETENPLVARAMADTIATEHSAGGGHTVEVSQTVHTNAFPVTAENRRLNWVTRLIPLPSPGSLNLAFMAQGNWYSLQDDGAGGISGTSSLYGSGTVDYVTGDVLFTAGALPDVGSQIMMTWASPAHYEIRTGAGEATCEIQLPDENIVKDTVSLSLMLGGSEITATDNGSGSITYTGGTVGTINYVTGLISLTIAPDSASSYTVTYDKGDPIVTEFTDPPRNTNGSVTLGLTTLPIKPNSVRLEWNTDVEIVVDTTRIRETLQVIPRAIDPIMIAYDNGAGRLLMANGQDVGGIDYNTGALTFTPDVTVSIPITNYSATELIQDTQGVGDAGDIVDIMFQGFTYELAPAIAPVDFDATVQYRTTDTSLSNSITGAPELTVDLTPGYMDVIVGGSVRFSGFGMNYSDRGDGSIYSDDLVCGSIDYENRKVNLTYWASAASLAVNVTSCLTRYGRWGVARAEFRSAAVPLKPEALSITATTLGGELITASGDSAGLIVGDKVKGSINYEFGVAKIYFGEIGDDPLFEGEGTPPQVWLPTLIDPTSLRYNAVAFSYLPLDADLIGLDPVRLPGDGRVPIFKDGDIIVISDEFTHSIAALPAAGAVVDLPKTFLADASISDTNGNYVPSTHYTFDRKLGKITFADPIDWVGYTAPLTVTYREEDMGLVADAQINGDLRLANPISKVFSAATAKVSSALIFGDMRTRYYNLFHQYSWSGTWSDSRSGSDTTSKYDEVSYPILVRNDAAIKQRWAIIFTSSTTFRCIGETRGEIGTGNTGTDFSPVNSLTERPYFFIDARGWGGGWISGNVVRFNTEASEPFWISRCVLQGEAPHEEDVFCIQARGDSE